MWLMNSLLHRLVMSNINVLLYLQYALKPLKHKHPSANDLPGAVSIKKYSKSI